MPAKSFGTSFSSTFTVASVTAENFSSLTVNSAEPSSTNDTPSGAPATTNAASCNVIVLSESKPTTAVSELVIVKPSLTVNVIFVPFAGISTVPLTVISSDSLSLIS